MNGKDFAEKSLRDLNAIERLYVQLGQELDQINAAINDPLVLYHDRVTFYHRKKEIESAIRKSDAALKRFEKEFPWHENSQ